MLEGKRVVVLAGSAGIGAAIARQAAEKGARVAITGRNVDRLSSAAASMPGAVDTFAFDAANREQVTEFFDRIGPIDHLVSCVGDTYWGGFLTLEEERARQIIEMKVWAQLFIVRSCHHLVAKDGSITLTGGTAMDRASIPHPTPFSVLGNTALGMLVKNLAAELAPIRINVVEPTLTETALFDDMDPADRKALFERFLKVTLLGRIPQPEQVARSYIHVMESGLINGDSVRPDGGPYLLPW